MLCSWLHFQTLDSVGGVGGVHKMNDDDQLAGAASKLDLKWGYQCTRQIVFVFVFLIVFAIVFVWIMAADPGKMVRLQL